MIRQNGISTSITTDGTGNKVAELRYKAWGEVRYSSGTTPSGYTYTGQYSNVTDFGLMYYNARWYDPALGRFAQADSVVPGGVQGLDRYAYALGNPLRYIDPTGHTPAGPRPPCEDSMPECGYANLGSGSEPSASGGNGDSGGNPLAATWNYTSACLENLGSCYTQGWTNAGSAWSICASQANFGDRLGACSYDVAWIEAHVVVVGGTVVIVRQGVIYALAYLATQNPDATETMIGRYYSAADNYVIRAGNEFTYFKLPDWAFTTLKSLGLDTPVNQQFIANQIAQAKDFFVYGTGGNTLPTEIDQIWNSGQYLDLGGLGNDIYSTFLQYIH